MAMGEDFCNNACDPRVRSLGGNCGTPELDKTTITSRVDVIRPKLCRSEVPNVGFANVGWIGEVPENTCCEVSTDHHFGACRESCVPTFLLPPQHVMGAKIGLCRQSALQRGTKLDGVEDRRTNVV